MRRVQVESDTTEVINLDLKDNDSKPVIINAENGSVVTVNVNVKNYYGTPEWFDRSAFDALLGTIKGRL